jgi:hypothetical protein
MAVEKAATSSGGSEIAANSSLSRFHMVVLGWDYFRLHSDNQVFFFLKKLYFLSLLPVFMIVLNFV